MKSCSLTIVCVIILVVILFMMFSGSNNNMYGLIEGMNTKNTTKDKNKNINPIKKAFETMGPVSTALTPGGMFIVGNGDGKENFEVRQPIGYADIVESKSDSWNLSKWVKNALRYFPKVWEMKINWIVINTIQVPLYLSQKVNYFSLLIPNSTPSLALGHTLTAWDVLLCLNNNITTS